MKTLNRISLALLLTAAMYSCADPFEDVTIQDPGIIEQAREENPKEDNEWNRDFNNPTDEPILYDRYGYADGYICILVNP